MHHYTVKRPFFVFVILFIFSVQALLSGCAKPDPETISIFDSITPSQPETVRTLEDILEPDELQSMIDEMKENDLFKNYYRDATIVIEKNDITYKYWYKQEYTDEEIETLKAQLEESNLYDQIDGLKESFKRSSGIRPDTISFIYYSSDNKLIANISK